MVLGKSRETSYTKTYLIKVLSEPIKSVRTNLNSEISDIEITSSHYNSIVSLKYIGLLGA